MNNYGCRCSTCDVSTGWNVDGSIPHTVCISDLYGVVQVLFKKCVEESAIGKKGVAYLGETVTVQYLQEVIKRVVDSCEIRYATLDERAQFMENVENCIRNVFADPEERRRVVWETLDRSDAKGAFDTRGVFEDLVGKLKSRLNDDTAVQDCIWFMSYMGNKFVEKLHGEFREQHTLLVSFCALKGRGDDAIQRAFAYAYVKELADLYLRVKEECPDHLANCILEEKEKWRQKCVVR